jgi:hypothetical protein
MKRIADEDLDRDRDVKRSKTVTQASIELPDDCWNIIYNYLTIESASSLYYVSTLFQRLHNSFMTQHYNRILGLSKDLAELLPASAKKSESQLGIIVMFEKAVSFVQSRRYEDLSSVLKQIKRKAEMELLRRNNHKFLPRLLRIYATNIESVLYAEHSKKTERVWELTDSIATNINEKSSFIWIAKDGRYIDVTSTYHSLYSVADGQGWLEFRITVILKHLREEHKNETIVFEFKKDPNDDSYHHTIEDCIFDHNKEENYFHSDDVKKIVQWLQLDLTTQISPLTFVLEMLLRLAFTTERRTYKNLRVREFIQKTGP